MSDCSNDSNSQLPLPFYSNFSICVGKETLIGQGFVNL